MRILYIYQNKVYGMNGGSLESRKVYESLLELQEEGLDLHVERLALEDTRVKKTRWKDIVSRILGHSNYFYLEWLKIKKSVLDEKYDLIVLGHSRLGFIAKDFRFEKATTVMTQFHNIEYDYVNVYQSKYQGFKRFFFTTLEKRSTKRDEADALRYSHHTLFMTEEDLQRSKELYQHNVPFSIIPICTKAIQHESMSANTKKLNLVFIGALNYPSNIDGLKWFLKEVWSTLQNDPQIQLIIGGSNPTIEIKTLLNRYQNLECHYNFHHFEDIVPSNSVFLSFVTSTAGMKTKAAEALAAGLVIIATKETFIGYGEAIHDPMGKNILIEANNSQDFLTQIQRRKDSVPTQEAKNRSLLLWEKYYSTERTKRELKSILSQL
ncbi:hypothetical protein SANA_27720 [Gottschalkiaceae bacterium SANA]|nr:hypothetical protein SANA_27720 [Gottschalkiaceae bacterium SANA]